MIRGMLSKICEIHKFATRSDGVWNNKNKIGELSASPGKNRGVIIGGKSVTKPRTVLSGIHSAESFYAWKTMGDLYSALVGSNHNETIL